MRRVVPLAMSAVVVTAFTIAMTVAASGCKPSRGAQVREGAHQDHAAAAAAPSTNVAAPPSPAGHEGHEGHSTGPHPIVPDGYADISLEPAQAKAIGMTTARLEERDFARQLRTTGIVTADETRTAHVHSKVRGWVDGINVNYVGQKVSPGQPLCGIYSQEVYAAEIEYLALLDRTRVETLPRGEFADQERKAREELIAAARRRLGLWDVPKAEIERLEATREARRTFPLLAPRGGVVVTKEVVDGMYVDPSVDLYTLSDLSRVWLLADVYESDVAAVRVGQIARLDVQGLAAAATPIEAKVAFLPPTINEPTRTLKIRFELANKDGKLRPGAFATVMMDLPLGRGLGVPESAVIRTGKRAVVFMVHEGEVGKGGTTAGTATAASEQHVMPREIQIGPLVDGFYRVDTGLSVGDTVATGAQFLLDSETRLRASTGGGGGGGGHGGHGGH